ncbi:MAG: OsmC family protein [Sphingobacteriales bacterium]|nr:OsmC family protein [Sphingobacteriales bacterium]
MIKINLNRVEGDAGFEATDSNGHIVRFDTSPETGGVNFGIRPMQGLLMSLGSCSGIDVVSILKKQRQEVKGFSISVEGEREEGKIPSLWTKVHMIFTLSGTIDEDKAKRACDLSVTKYCSVAETLRRAGATVTWDLIIK